MGTVNPAVYNPFQPAANNNGTTANQKLNGLGNLLKAIQPGTPPGQTLQAIRNFQTGLQGISITDLQSPQAAQQFGSILNAFNEQVTRIDLNGESSEYINAFQGVLTGIDGELGRLQAENGNNGNLLGQILGNNRFVLRQTQQTIQQNYQQLQESQEQDRQNNLKKERAKQAGIEELRTAALNKIQTEYKTLQDKEYELYHKALDIPGLHLMSHAFLSSIKEQEENTVKLAENQTQQNEKLREFMYINARQHEDALQGIAYLSRFLA